MLYVLDAIKGYVMLCYIMLCYLFDLRTITSVAKTPASASIPSFDALDLLLGATSTPFIVSPFTESLVQVAPLICAHCEMICNAAVCTIFLDTIHYIHVHTHNLCT